MRSRDAILAALSATPNRIKDLVHGLTDRQLRQQPRAGEWSLGEIVKHLLLGERDLILPRLRRMREGDAPVFPSSLVDRTGFAAVPIPDDFSIDFGSFCAARQETLFLLGSAKDREWQYHGTTPTRGTLTIEAYAEYLASHDLEHLEQLRQTRQAITGVAGSA